MMEGRQFAPMSMTHKSRPVGVNVVHYVASLACFVIAMTFLLGGVMAVLLAVDSYILISGFFLLNGVYAVLAWGWFRHQRWVLFPFIISALTLLGQLWFGYLYGLHVMQTTYYLALAVMVAFLVTLTAIGWFTRQFLTGDAYKAALQLPMAAVLLLPLLLTSVPIVQSDGPPVEDTALDLAAFVPVPDGENALYAMLLRDDMTAVEVQAIENNSDLLGSLSTGEVEAANSSVVNYIQDTQRIADKFVTAAAKPYSQTCEPLYVDGVPEVVDQLFEYGYDYDCEPYGDTQTALTVTAIHALYYANIGDMDKALNYNTALLNYANLVYNEQPSSFIGYLVANTFMETGLSVTETILEDTETLTKEQKQLLHNSLEKNALQDESLLNAVKAEYQVLKPYLLAIGTIFDLPLSERQKVKAVFDADEEFESNHVIGFFDMFPVNNKAIRYLYHSNDTLRLHHDYFNLYVQYPDLCDEQQLSSRQVALKVQQERFEAIYNSASSQNILWNVLQSNYMGRVMFATTATVGMFETLVADSHCPIKQKNVALQQLLKTE